MGGQCGERVPAFWGKMAMKQGFKALALGS